jgi:hypothetical protein
MRIFVDFIDIWGDYDVTGQPSSVDRTLPLAVLMSPVFLEASGHRVRTNELRLYHVESSKFYTVDDVATAVIDDLDTLIVVDTEDERYHVPEALASLWVRRGGSARRVSYMVVPQATDSWWPEVTTVH